VPLDELAAQCQEGLANALFVVQEAFEETAGPFSGEDSRNLTFCTNHAAGALRCEVRHEPAIEKRGKVGGFTGVDEYEGLAGETAFVQIAQVQVAQRDAFMIGEEQCGPIGPCGVVKRRGCGVTIEI